MVNVVPLWGMLLITLLLVLVAVEIGYRLGLRKRQRVGGEPEAPVGTVVAAMLGLLAFLLAFTFGNAASRYETRKELLLREVNSIETTYLRASFLPPPLDHQARTLLHAYVADRVQLANITSHSRTRTEAIPALEKSLKKASSIQTELWTIATQVSHQLPESKFAPLFVQSLNEILDVHTERVTIGLQYQIPASIWIALYFISTLAMGTLGFQFGMTAKGGRHVSLALALAFSAVILLIVDLDRSMEGRLRISQQPVVDLLQRISPPQG